MQCRQSFAIIVWIVLFLKVWKMHRTVIHEPYSHETIAFGDSVGRQFQPSGNCGIQLSGNTRALTAFVVADAVIFALEFIVLNPSQTQRNTAMQTQIPCCNDPAIGKSKQHETFIEQLCGKRSMRNFMRERDRIPKRRKGFPISFTKGAVSRPYKRRIA